MIPHNGETNNKNTKRLQKERLQKERLQKGKHKTIENIQETIKQHIPFIYVFSHWLLGYLGYYNKTFIILFFVYQLYQYSIDRRFYLLPYCKYDNKSGMTGNTFEHTLRKLKQGLYGYIIAYLVNLLCNKFFK